MKKPPKLPEKMVITLGKTYPNPNIGFSDARNAPLRVCTGLRAIRLWGPPETTAKRT